MSKFDTLYKSIISEEQRPEWIPHVKCDKCGETITDADLPASSDEFHTLCNKCVKELVEADTEVIDPLHFSDPYHKCYSCEHVFPYAELNETADGQYVCDDCIEGHIAHYGTPVKLERDLYND